MGLFQPRPIRHVFRKRRNHRLTFFANRRSQKHALRFVAAQLPRFEVRDDDDLAADQLFRLVVLGDAGENLARLLFPDIHGQQ